MLRNDKGVSLNEDIICVNIYVPSIGAHKYILQILKNLKGETDSNTAIVRDINAPLTSMDRSSRHNNKEILALSDTLN